MWVWMLPGHGDSWTHSIPTLSSYFFHQFIPIQFLYYFFWIFKDMACTCNLCIHFNFSVMEGTWFGNMDQPLRAVSSCIKCHGSQRPCRHNGAHCQPTHLCCVLTTFEFPEHEIWHDVAVGVCQPLRVLTRILKWLPKASRLYHVHRSLCPFWKQLSVRMLENPGTVGFIFQPVASDNHVEMVEGKSLATVINKQINEENYQSLSTKNMAIHFISNYYS